MEDTGQLLKLTEYAIRGMNPHVNYGLWVIMVCQGRFVSCNKGTTLAEDIDNGRVYAYAEA